MKGGKDVQKPTQEAGCRVLPRSVTTGGNTSRECQRESERTGERGPKSKKTQIRQEQRVGRGVTTLWRSQPRRQRPRPPGPERPATAPVSRPDARCWPRLPLALRGFRVACQGIPHNTRHLFPFSFSSHVNTKQTPPAPLPRDREPGAVGPWRSPRGPSRRC